MIFLSAGKTLSSREIGASVDQLQSLVRKRRCRRSLLSSHVWKHVQRFRLTKSMRDRGDIPYAKRVLQVAAGEGDVEQVTLSDSSTVIPLEHTSKDSAGSEHVCQINGTTNFEDLVQAVYPDLLQVNHNTFDDRGTLAPTNDSIDQINEYVLDMLPGDAQHE